MKTEAEPQLSSYPQSQPSLPKSQLREEFNLLMRANARSIHRFVTLRGVYSRDVADVVQQAFFLAYRKWSDFRPGSSRRAWLFGIARNCAADYRRQLNRRRAAHDGYELASAAASSSERDPEVRTQASDELRLLNRVLNELKQPLRSVFVLYEIEGLSMAEIAAIEAIPEQTGYSRLRTARDYVERRFRELEKGVQ